MRKTTCLRAYATLGTPLLLLTNMRLSTCLHAFATLTKCGQKYVFVRLRFPKQNHAKVLFCTSLPSQANMRKIPVCTPLLSLANEHKGTSATQSKVGQFFRVCSHLLYKANLIKIWILIIFAYLRKRIQY